MFALYNTNINSTEIHLQADINLKALCGLKAFLPPGEAIRREKEIKGWKRAKKIKLIEQSNPEWKDLFGKMYMNSRKRYRKMSDDWNPDKSD